MSNESNLENFYYFGCSNDSKGHYLVNRKLERVYRSEDEISESFGFSWRKLDTGFLPKTNKEGAAKVTNINKWTILSFNDYSVDSRGKSNSTYAIRGELNFKDALEKAKVEFPSIFERYGFEVTEF